MSSNNARYTYAHAGFNNFFQRSIDSHAAPTLNDAAAAVMTKTQEVNFDQSQTTGSLGSNIQLGSVNIDGSDGRITISDGNTVRVILGEQQGGF